MTRFILDAADRRAKRRLPRILFIRLSDLGLKVLAMVCEAFRG